MKTRFVEIEGEGVRPNIEALMKICFSSQEIADGIQAKLSTEASKKGLTTLAYVSRKKINFQNYDDFKRAFKKVYRMDLPFASNESDLINDVKTAIKYRHRIVHISPLVTPLNTDIANGHVNATPELRDKMTQSMNRFIKLFHNLTLRLI